MVRKRLVGRGHFEDSVKTRLLSFAEEPFRPAQELGRIRRNLVCQRRRFAHQIIWRRDVCDQACLQCRISIKGGTRKNHFRSSSVTHHFWQEPCASIGWKQSDLDKARSEDGRAGSDADVAHTRKIATQPNRGAVDSRDDGKVQPIQRPRNTVDPGPILRGNLFWRAGKHASLVPHFADISAGTKCGTLTGQYDGSYAGIAIEPSDRFFESNKHIFAIDRIPSPRIVEREDYDIVVLCVLQLFVHGLYPLARPSKLARTNCESINRIEI